MISWTPYKPFKWVQFRSSVTGFFHNKNEWGKNIEVGKGEKPKSTRTKTLLFIKALQSPFTQSVFSVIRKTV